MKNLESEFVPYNLALRMKELGYDEPCFGWFGVDGGLIVDIGCKNSTHTLQYIVSAPTFQSAFSWLIPQINGEFKVCLDEDGWYIYNLENKIFRGDEAVEKLIEIVEQKQLKND
jgi:hypothetical protein